MPYTPPVDEPTAGEPGDPTTPDELPLNRTRPASAGGRDPHQELQVRLTAQRIITAHLTPPLETNPEQARDLRPDPQQPFWPDVDVDLTGATLVDWDMTRGRVRKAAFSKATFTGHSSFTMATFTGAATFDRATFTGDAWFGRATFSGPAWFDGATFTGPAWFDGATYTGPARFDKATFTGHAWFGEATFTGGAVFGGAAFTGGAVFAQCRVALRHDRDDVWPRGWRLEPESDGVGKLVNDASTALPGP